MSKKQKRKAAPPRPKKRQPQKRQAPKRKAPKRQTQNRKAQNIKQPKRQAPRRKAREIEAPEPELVELENDENGVLLYENEDALKASGQQYNDDIVKYDPKKPRRAMKEVKDKLNKTRGGGSHYFALVWITDKSGARIGAKAVYMPESNPHHVPPDKGFTHRAANAIRKGGGARKFARDYGLPRSAVNKIVSADKKGLSAWAATKRGQAAFDRFSNLWSFKTGVDWEE